MLTSSTVVKSHLQISGTTYDTVLASLVTQVDSYIEKKTGVKVGSSAAVTLTNEIRDSDGSLIITTKFKPIASITKIEAKDGSGNWIEYTDEVVGSIDFDTEGDRIFTKYVVNGKGKRNLRLSYTAGYISTGSANVPKDLELCATLMVAGLFNQRGLTGLSSQTVLTLTQSISDFVNSNPFIQETLNRYTSVYAL